MKKSRLILFFISFLITVTGLRSHELAELQRELSQFFDHLHTGRARSAGAMSIRTHDVNSDLAQAHTRQLRAAQTGLEILDGGEEIIFCLNDGIYVQQADGTGRRQLIRRDTGYRAFSYPAWSLDGKKIAFAANQTDSRIVDLVVANADGSAPTVIRSLNQGYYHSYIWSISWSWDNQYLMFTYAFDDVNLNSLYIACTIHHSGTNFVIGPGPDQSFCQYEPVAGSKRYAYIAAGQPFNMNTALRVSNLDGTNNRAWLTINGTISGFTHLAWNNATSIYTVIRYWNQYPNKECILRVASNGQNQVINISDLKASLWCPTVSPNRQQFYSSELYANNTSQLWLTKLGTSTTNFTRGSGAYPNWRQQIPILQPPDKPILSAPQNNASVKAVSDLFGNWVVLSWIASARAESYNIEVRKVSGELVHSLSNRVSTEARLSISFDTQYTWKVQAKNSAGTSAWSDPWKFTVKPKLSVESRTGTAMEFALLQNYPNPFNSQTIIGFVLPQVCQVTLEIFNSRGQRQTILTSSEMQAGQHQVVWNASGMPGGIYYYTIRTKAPGTRQPDFVATRKLVLLK